MIVDDMGMQTLATIIDMYEIGGYVFGRANAEQLKDDAATVFVACRQMVGMGRKGAHACKVTASSFDGAVIRILSLVILLVGSGELDELVDVIERENGEDDYDD